MTVLLLSLHSLASNLYLPLLPKLRALVGATPEQAQLTLTAFVFGFGMTQLLWGAASDRWGRRPTLLVGLALYVLSAAGAGWTQDVPTLLALRGLQGAGVAAAGVCARALLRDWYAPDECIRKLAFSFAWLGVVSLAAPFAGALLAVHAPIEAGFALLAAAGVLALGVVLVVLPSGRRREDNIRLASIIRTWPSILVHPTFSANTLLTCCTYCGHYLFLVASSYVLVEREGCSPTVYAAILSMGSAFHLIGTWCCQRWVARIGVVATVKRAGYLSLLSGVALFANAASGTHAPWALIAPQWIYIFAHAIHQSCGQGSAMAPFRDTAGSASALQGTILPLVASIAAASLAEPLAHRVGALPLAMAVCAGLTAVVALVWLPATDRISNATRQIRTPDPTADWSDTERGS